MSPGISGQGKSYYQTLQREEGHLHWVANLWTDETVNFLSIDIIVRIDGERTERFNLQGLATELDRKTNRRLYKFSFKDVSVPPHTGPEAGVQLECVFRFEDEPDQAKNPDQHMRR